MIIKQTTVAETAQAMQDVLTIKAEELGQTTGFVKRKSKLSGAKFAQCLVYGWLANEQSSLQELSQSARNVGVTVSRQAINKRFSPEAVDLMRELLAASLEKVVKGYSQTLPLLAPFKAIYAMDSSVVTLPDELQEVWKGVQGSGLKLSVCWELQQGHLPVLHLHDASEHDQAAPKPMDELEAGALWLADLAYFKLDSFQDFDRRGIYFISRLKAKTTLYDAQGQALDLTEKLAQLKEGEVQSIDIRLGAEHQLPCRLVIQRLGPEARARQERQLLEYERKKQTKASAERWLWCGYNIFITNIPVDILSPTEVLAVARLRWQIELLFKLWKNDLHMDEWRSANPHRILCELYGKIIAAIIQHWFLLMSDIHHLEYSMFQARSTIRKLIWGIAAFAYDFEALYDRLCHLRATLQGCYVASSAARPSTFKRLSS